MALSAQKTQEIGAQYDPLRARAKQQEAAALQGQQDNLTRNAARLGGAPNGAFVKQEQIAGNESAQRLTTANEGIDAQQAAALNQARDVQEGRDYQTSERLDSQGFAAQESAMARKLQQYGIDTSDKTQRYGIDTNAKFQEAALTGRLGQNQTLAGKTYADSVAQNKFENNSNLKTNAINTIVTLKNSGYAPDQIGSLLHSLGIDKLGLDLNELMGVTTAPPPVPKPAPQSAAPTNKDKPLGSDTSWERA